MLMVSVLVRGFAMLVSEAMFDTARSARVAECAEITYVFFSADRRFTLCGRGQKEKVYSIMIAKTIAGCIIT